MNRSADGSEILATDLDFQERSWELKVDNLTDQELQSIRDLHEQVEGRLQTFLFLEPGANLLSWSGLLSDTVWTKDPGIMVLDGQPDPFGGNGGGRVTSSGGQGAISQVLNIPASYRYAGSVWARTSSTGASLQVSDTAAQTVSAAIDTTNQWKRYSVGYNLSSVLGTLSFTVVVPAGASVDVYGPQLEAQPAPSKYKKTSQQSGVYSSVRFADDVLQDRATGVNRHSGSIRIVWIRSQT